jgi:caa(3)-type oxidase subunit IV
MDDTHTGQGHGNSGVTAYLVIFAALAVFTIISFVVNSAVRSHSMQSQTGFVIILLVAVCKAVLVATFFMHLKFDWKKLYFMIVPVMILGTMMIIVLLPDIVLAWPH